MASACASTLPGRARSPPVDRPEDRRDHDASCAYSAPAEHDEAEVQHGHGSPPCRRCVHDRRPSARLPQPCRTMMAMITGSQASVAYLVALAAASVQRSGGQPPHAARADPDRCPGGQGQEEQGERSERGEGTVMDDQPAYREQQRPENSRETAEELLADQVHQRGRREHHDEGQRPGGGQPASRIGRGSQRRVERGAAGEPAREIRPGSVAAASGPLLVARLQVQRLIGEGRRTPQPWQRSARA